MSPRIDFAREAQISRNQYWFDRAQLCVAYCNLQGITNEQIAAVLASKGKA